MALTEEGFRRRTYDDILTDKIYRAMQLFGADIDTSELTPLGKFLRINAYDQAIAEEEIEAAYYARFPDTATGQSLDRLCVFAGIAREQAQPSKYTVQITGTADTEIPVGFLVGTESGLTFYNTSAATIAAGGTCDITAVCTLPGAVGNVLASSIDRSVNPTASVSTVSGVALVTAGKEEEADNLLRERIKSAMSGAGSCSVDSIRSAILRIPTVESVGIVVNDTDEEDTGGRPPHSFECYVTGGEDYHAQIGETIFDKKPVGIKTDGDISVTVTDSGQHAHAIKFSHSGSVTINVKVTVRTTGDFPASGADDIEASIESYIRTHKTGESVYLSTLYGYIYCIGGVAEVTSLTMAKGTGAYGTSNIAISEHEVARCGTVEVTVT